MLCFPAPTGEVSCSSGSSTCLNSTPPSPDPRTEPKVNRTSSLFSQLLLLSRISPPWQGEADQRGPTAPQQATRSASLSSCCWGSQRWESPAWCCALSKASSTSTRRAPSEVRTSVFSRITLCSRGCMSFQLRCVCVYIYIHTHSLNEVLQNVDDNVSLVTFHT